MATIKKRFNLCVGKKYTKGTEEKTQWIKVGNMSVWDDGGISQQIDTLPTGQWWDGKISVFEEIEKDSQPQITSQQTSQPKENNDLPF